MSEYITPKTIFASDKGGILDIVRDGEVLASIAVPPGLVAAREYLAIVPEGATLQVASGLATVEHRSGYGRQPYGKGSHDTGANPDFVPARIDRNEAQMRLALSKLQMLSSRLDARERALSRVERMPDAPQPDPVLEDLKDMEPEPVAEKPRG